MWYGYFIPLILNDKSIGCYFYYFQISSMFTYITRIIIYFCYNFKYLMAGSHKSSNDYYKYEKILTRKELAQWRSKCVTILKIKFYNYFCTTIHENMYATQQTIYTINKIMECYYDFLSSDSDHCRRTIKYTIKK